MANDKDDIQEKFVFEKVELNNAPFEAQLLTQNGSGDGLESSPNLQQPTLSASVDKPPTMKKTISRRQLPANSNLFANTSASARVFLSTSTSSNSRRTLLANSSNLNLDASNNTNNGDFVPSSLSRAPASARGATDKFIPSFYAPPSPVPSSSIPSPPASVSPPLPQLPPVEAGGVVMAFSANPHFDASDKVFTAQALLEKEAVLAHLEAESSSSFISPQDCSPSSPRLFPPADAKAFSHAYLQPYQSYAPSFSPSLSVKSVTSRGTIFSTDNSSLRASPKSTNRSLLQDKSLRSGDSKGSFEASTRPPGSAVDTVCLSRTEYDAIIENEKELREGTMSKDKVITSLQARLTALQNQLQQERTSRNRRISTLQDSIVTLQRDVFTKEELIRETKVEVMDLRQRLGVSLVDAKRLQQETDHQKDILASTQEALQKEKAHTEHLTQSLMQTQKKFHDSLVSVTTKQNSVLTRSTLQIVNTLPSIGSEERVSPACNDQTESEANSVTTSIPIHDQDFIAAKEKSKSELSLSGNRSYFVCFECAHCGEKNETNFSSESQPPIDSFEPQAYITQVESLQKQLSIVLMDKKISTIENRSLSQAKLDLERQVESLTQLSRALEETVSLQTQIRDDESLDKASGAEFTPKKPEKKDDLLLSNAIVASEGVRTETVSAKEDDFSEMSLLQTRLLKTEELLEQTKAQILQERQKGLSRSIVVGFIAISAITISFGFI